MFALLLATPLTVWIAAVAPAGTIAASTPTTATNSASWPDAGRLAAGGQHTCVVMDDATVRCWGDNRGGQLGDGSLAARTDPTTVAGLTGVTAIAAGTMHTCALRRDRSVACWGTRELLRPRTEVDPAEVALKTITGLPPADAIFAGRNLSCAVVKGAPWCWGRTSMKPPLERPGKLPGLSGVDELVIGWDHLCARIGGKVSCATPDPRTTNMTDTSTSLAGIDDALALAGGDRHVCVLRATGRVVCLGQLPYPDDDYSNFDWLAQTEVVEVAGASRVLPTGNSHSCAEMSDGEVRCWGDASHGQLGNGLAQPWRRPVAVRGLRSPRAMAAGWGHTCAITAKRQVLCWGRNDGGQAGFVELSREVPELRRDPRNNLDSVASQMRNLLRQRLVPRVILHLDDKPGTPP